MINVGGLLLTLNICSYRKESKHGFIKSYHMFTASSVYWYLVGDTFCKANEYFKVSRTSCIIYVVYKDGFQWRKGCSA